MPDRAVQRRLRVGRAQVWRGCDPRSGPPHRGDFVCKNRRQGARKCTQPLEVVPGASTPSPTMDASVDAGGPAFNVVGQGGTSQLASAIAEQESAPSRSYVVAQDVTTAQALERSIIDSASLG